MSVAGATLSFERVTLKLRHTFATSQYAVDAKETLVVRFESGGITGLGEATPSALYEQSLEQTEGVLAEVGRRLPEDPDAFEPWLGEITGAYPHARDGMAAVDAALRDWHARRLGAPVYRVLGHARPRVATCFTIGLADRATMASKTDEALAAGYRVLKIKLGSEGDEALLAAIRERHAGPLLVDANQAWAGGAEAVSAVRGLARFEPTIIEQPVPKHDAPALAELRRLGVAPIYADESCETLADLLRIANTIDGVNIKLGKCGGLGPAREMVAAARGLGLGVLLGCFVSSSLAIAPALPLAGAADFVDVDGPLLLARDPFVGLICARGVITAPDAPGWGLQQVAG